MNLAQFEYIIALVEAGSYSQAAKNLYISPQALSRSVADMERELGAKLVEKSGRGVTVTALAIEISRLAEVALQSVSEMKGLARCQTLACNTQERLRIALFSTPYRGSPFAESDLRCFEGDHPDVRLELSSYSNDTCITALLEDVADVSIVMGRPLQPEITSSKIASVRPVAVMLTDLARAYEANVKFSDLATMPLAMPSDLRCGYSNLLDIFKKRGLSASLVNVAPDLEAQRRFVLEGGVILCFENAPLASLVSEASSVFLNTSEETAWPIFLASKKDNCSTLAMALLDHLRIIAKNSWIN